MKTEPGAKNTRQNETSTVKKNQMQGVIRRAITILPVAGILLGTTGTLSWPRVWIFIGICALIFIVLTVMSEPEVGEERQKMHHDAKLRDKNLVFLLFLMGFLVIIIAGLDRQFGWTGQVPVYLQIAGACLFAIGYVFSTWAVISNKFFSTIVQIQNDRGHHPVSSGPYRFVRHPGYAGMLVYVLAEPLMLGSSWALIPAVLMIPLCVIRTALEDRTLQEELPGYRDYAGRVKYRLVPGVW